MSTLVRTRTPLKTLSMNTQPQRRRSSRLAAYDQSDGDFQFMRGSKRKKPEPEPIPEEPKAPQPRARPAAEKNEAPAASKKPRRHMTFESPAEQTASTKRATRRSTRFSSENSAPEAPATVEAEVEVAKEAPEAGHALEDEPTTTPESSSEVTKIALPLTDTPIIERNKNMRKKSAGVRRSSLGMRGRRASSLIDNGHSALPHREVSAVEFYKHIAAEGLPEPRRMKQLLMWCGERALGEKPAHNTKDSAEMLAARAIKQALLKDFANRPEMSDWFSREEAEPPAVVVKKPNPLNIQNSTKIQELEARIKRLKEEKAQWKALTKDPPSIPSAPLESDVSPSAIDVSLLDPEQASILSSLSSDTSDHLKSHVTAHLSTLQARLEFTVDRFADGLHKLDQFRNTADRAAARVLALSAGHVEKREHRDKAAVGTQELPVQEVLRSLSRVLNETGGSSGAVR